MESSREELKERIAELEETVITALALSAAKNGDCREDWIEMRSILCKLDIVGTGLLQCSEGKVHI